MSNQKYDPRSFSSLMTSLISVFSVPIIISLSRYEEVYLMRPINAGSFGTYLIMTCKLMTLIDPSRDIEDQKHLATLLDGVLIKLGDYFITEIS